MRASHAVLLNAVLTGVAAAQSYDRNARIASLSENAARVRSIDPTLLDDDFSDLQSLGARIGNARIVVLGEPSHGDGAAFLAKSRLVKFLHRKLGFEVLAWEAGVFNCYDMNHALSDSHLSVGEAMERGLYPIWSSSAQVRTVFDYARSVAATKSRLEVAGFDPQFSGRGGSRWRDAMIAFVDRADPAILPEPLRTSLTKDADAIWGSKEPTPVALRSLAKSVAALPKALQHAKPRLRSVHGSRATDLMIRSADDAVIALEIWARFRAGTGNFNLDDSNFRDRRMAENLVWLANERYKRKRIIVWAATFHALHSPSSIKLPPGSFSYEGVSTMGEIARRTFGRKLYTIAFTAAEGSAGRSATSNPKIGFKTPQDGSFEDLCLRLSHPFLYVDLNRLPESNWLRGAVRARPLSYSPIETNWRNQFDGLFFIRTMFPASSDRLAPDGAVLTQNR